MIKYHAKLHTYIGDSVVGGNAGYFLMTVMYWKINVAPLSAV